ncbi:phenylalanine--tRNA ligase subunit beta [Ascidiimonas aurantiaca]|uniref:phenylalanine--tRNA ligase subunit beta n=1 Tax=Ascidiimonas aurantiaca TaxID=1685432 RepID=UPI0030ED1037
MKISYNWLKQFLKIDWEAGKTAELLTNLGLEIEGIFPFESVKGGLKNIVVGNVLTCIKHPNADRLKVTTVDIGNDRILQIVCGAPNVEEGQKVAVALVGTTLYDKDGEPWQIKKGKIRGEVSEGMICAEDELGLGTNHDGIMVLDNSLQPGTPCADVFEIENDHIFEIGLTPNRADAMSHFGVARDLKAGLLQQKKPLELITPSVSSFKVDNRTLKIDVEIQDKELCSRYCGVTISNVTVKESPQWLKNRLTAIGLTPKNNIVDVTNYVLHELGQPLHAFDASVIKGNKIQVKTLPQGTRFTTLDGVERTLHNEDLMICDTEKPLCIAGVFGGENSGVTGKTTKVFLESAYFNPVSVRKTAKRHALSTDASFRFERGIDINTVKYAMLRATLLIQEVAGGIVTSDIIDVFPKKIEDHQVFLTFEKVNSLVGQEIPRETVKSILTSLEVKINNVTETGIGLTIPSYRVDVTREADVIEDILRVYGYNNIAVTEKLNASISHSVRFADDRISNIVADNLVALGYYEIINNSLTNPDYITLSEQITEEAQITMMNPLSGDLSALRQSVLFTGMETIAFNTNRKRPNLRLFEFGKTYHQYNGNIKEEKKHLALFMTGNKTEKHWNTSEEPGDFFHFKSVVMRVLERLGFTNIKSAPVKSDLISEGLSFSSGKHKLVDMGTVSKKIRQFFDVKNEVFYADFDWDHILRVLAQQNIKFEDIPRFPEVKRDFALLVNKDIQFKDIYQTALQSEKRLLKEVTLFDVYEGNNLPEGKKSYAVSFTLQPDKGTLTDKDIDKVMRKLQTSFENQIGAELR